MNKKRATKDKGKFSMPDNVTEIDISQFPSIDSDLLFRAQETAFDAMGARTAKKNLELAQKALAISPWCVDAWRIIGNHEEDPQKAIQIYHLAMEIGKTILGKDFDELKGEFWGFSETRPYMRAKAALADALYKAGDQNGAIAEYQELLELNPNDNQGIREALLPALLKVGRDKEAKQLLNKYKENSANWHYAKALLEYRKGGNEDAANKALQMAMKRNQYGAEYLSGKKKMPKKLPGMYSIGSEEEAIYLGYCQKEVWDATDGAKDWLKDKLASVKAASD